MEAVLFIGLQASGKSSYYKERFFTSHVRISLDLLKTRHREKRLLAMCLETNQPFVVDNTNPMLADRGRYLKDAKEAGFTVVGYYFQSRIADCLERNQHRPNPVPVVALLATSGKLVLPSYSEGFDTLKYVQLTSTGFVVEEWTDEV
ncbi:MAG: ATP-binding protein [Zavarzinella sp.]